MYKYTMSIETADKNSTARADNLQLTGSALAMDTRDADLMTLNSALIETCPKYRAEHERTGDIDPDEDAPGSTLHNHECPNCADIQDMAGALNTTLVQLSGNRCLEITKKPEKLRKVRNLHNLLLGQVHMAAAMADKHIRGFQPEE